ncbi:hypothetical protein MA16_Dca015058 [Dendrobium catenatum]|uniref:Uncharacterized protein n=1 Tax=Dendrobium catenatum TaxID=906689 RepID=A0A2I0VTQ5_9ASPA|nr:hypothetical protein MA16_Dca015058 [Dendrobium catenatum]
MGNDMGETFGVATCYVAFAFCCKWSTILEQTSGRYLSPNALPFFPPALVANPEGSLGNPLLTDSISEEIAVVKPSVNISVDAGCLVKPMVSNQLLGDEAVQPVASMETVCPVSVEQVEPSRNSLLAAMPDGNRVDITDVGGKAGVDVRSHGDGLHNLSECDSDYDSYSDPGNENTMVRDRPISGSSRGKFWGKGGRKDNSVLSLDRFDFRFVCRLQGNDVAGARVLVASLWQPLLDGLCAVSKMLVASVVC